MADINASAAAPHVNTGSDEATNAASSRAPRGGLLGQPSTWSALWALAALVILGLLRGSLRKLT